MDTSKSEIPSGTAAQPSSVVVHGRASGFAQEITVGDHRLVSDEPATAGGTDTGSTPYDLLLAALGSCTSMTLGLYARRKHWPLEGVTVRLRHSRAHATDCLECQDKAVMLDRIDCAIELRGVLTDEQRGKLLEIAKKCPVHRTLTSEIAIYTHLA
ncbi:MAG TPA: OsmC family protein [Burkholderiales bacterium]|nr:OsmC family protein [Burkholderiales bacterium]